MKLLRFVFFLSLLPTFSFAQRGGHGGGGGGGFHGSSGGGGFHGGSVGGGGGMRSAPMMGSSRVGGAVNGGVNRGFVGSGGLNRGFVGNGGFNRGFVGSGFGRFNGFRNFGGSRFFFGFGGFPFYGYGWPGYGFGYGWPGYYSPYYGDGYYPDPNYGYSTGGYYPDSSYGSYGYGAGADYGASPQPPVVINQQYSPNPPSQSSASESYYRRPDYYLIAFNDHTIQAAISFSVEGDQIRWTTREHTEKSAPLASVDRRFSEQINRDRRVDFRLP
jgi:hypothetical protein